MAAISERLTRGTILAIDRSATAIAAARRRNADFVQAGRVTFTTVALADLAVGRARFDKIFAVNVNLFWRRAAGELAGVRRLLAPRGHLHLVYEPPTAAQVARIGRETTRTLTESGFSDIVVRMGSGSAQGLIHVAARCLPAPASKLRRSLRCR